MPDAPRPDDDRTPAPAPDAPAGGATSDVPAPDGTVTAAGTATPEASAGAAPTEAELERLATPATVRRAPRYRAFMTAGALVGVVAGVVLAFATASGSGVVGDDGGVLPFLGGQNGVRWILALALGVVGAFGGAVVALVADRRSTRRRPRG